MTSSRRGFSLVEIMVAMTILTIALGDFAAITFWYIRSTVAATATLNRGAQMNMQVQRLSVIPFDSLPTRAGCTSHTDGPAAYQFCITVNDVSTTHRTVTLVTVPAVTRSRPDTIRIERTSVTAFNPLIP